MGPKKEVAFSATIVQEATPVPPANHFLRFQWHSCIQRISKNHMDPPSTSYHECSRTCFYGRSCPMFERVRSGPGRIWPIRTTTETVSASRSASAARRRAGRPPRRSTHFARRLPLSTFPQTAQAMCPRTRPETEDGDQKHRGTWES